MKPLYLRRRFSRRVGRARSRLRRATRATGRAIGWLARLSIPLTGVGSVCYAAFLVNVALGFLVTGVVLLVIDWWIERQSSD